MNKKVFVILGAFFLIAAGMNIGNAQAVTETESEKYFTLLDEQDRPLTQISGEVEIGDEFISADNYRYQVVTIEAESAHCVNKGKENMPQLNFDEVSDVWVFAEGSANIEAKLGEGKNKKPTVAIYHTHSDESYVPSDGRGSIDGNGGIYDVGKVLADKLKSLGINVIYSESNHNPHDFNAYSRSRKTAASLLRKNPNIILDVHRDALAPEQYEAKINGKEVTKIKLVVGKQNPNKNTNLEFAKQIKAAMDQKTPGLSNGIFIGKGVFNQDLSPRSVLIEVGSHTNSKEEAEEGVKMFADALSSVLGVSSASGFNGNAPAANNQSAGILKTLLILCSMMFIVIGAYVLMNKKAFQE
ncbi:MAG: stage II sporulation protein P [Syntrophomonadaceae bacterium]|jgi:stage II sporulation protein P|nr:stage II sporulation protein P [Syntrophomonadaceae bacterium]